MKWMEKTGVGRPSTYASTVKTLKKRNYVKVKGGKLIPTEVGEEVVDFLAERHPWMLSPELTAEMEEKLDLVEQGKLDWRKPVLESLEKVRELLKLLDRKRDDTPTENQLELARKLSQQLGKEIDGKVLSSKKELSSWITKAIREAKKQSLNRPLTEKQKAVIEKNGDEKVKRALQEGDYAYCRKWLDSFFRSLKKRKGKSGRKGTS